MHKGPPWETDCTQESQLDSWMWQSQGNYFDVDDVTLMNRLIWFYQVSGIKS